jgi:hypothetical protein
MQKLMCSNVYYKSTNCDVNLIAHITLGKMKSQYIFKTEY